jgi:BirA family biotin operon repressor/biotin-[acetyl-CoA-carboxylase] ligase
MYQVEINNPFGAPVYYEETVSSTMNVSKDLARSGAAHGTVIMADFQESGRGRSSRVWVSEKGQNLMFTILLRYNKFSSIPAALTLRAGLAVSLALEDFFPALAGKVKVKWPNDIMLFPGKADGKAAGILAEISGLAELNGLAEAETSLVFLGAGINLGQKTFPKELQGKAVSIASFLEEPEKGAGAWQQRPQLLLEKILFYFFEELENAETWKQRLEERLYKKGAQVTFIEGAADSGKIVQGRLEGIGDGGELLLLLNGEITPRPFITGELKVGAL